MTTAKTFWFGCAQAVRLPEACRFAGAAVHIRRRCEGIDVEPAIPVGWLPIEGERINLLDYSTMTVAGPLPNRHISTTVGARLFQLSYLLDNDAVCSACGDAA